MGQHVAACPLIYNPHVLVAMEQVAGNNVSALEEGFVLTVRNVLINSGTDSPHTCIISN